MIEKDKIVAFHYVLRNESGEEIENIFGDEPMVYLHGGYRNLLPKLEEALEGKEKDDKIEELQCKFEELEAKKSREISYTSVCSVVNSDEAGLVGFPNFETRKKGCL